MIAFNTLPDTEPIVQSTEPSHTFRVLTLVDSLEIGGTERVAVSFANRLAETGHHSCLCSTRHEGPLSGQISAAVPSLCLHRTKRVQWSALKRLVQFIREHEIEIIHAHSSSILTANLVALAAPFPKIVWHDHFGPNDRQERSTVVYRTLLRRARGVITVSQPLADWSRDRLRFPSDRIWCLPNFVDVPTSTSHIHLPGVAGKRIVCVANIRPVKDHVNLIRAMRTVVDRHSDAHLILVGGQSDVTCVDSVRHLIADSNLTDHVTMMGPRNDVTDILANCDIGVLASKSEGLPVSLLEYGAANLGVVVTDVGQCPAVVDHGKGGQIVPPEDSQALGRAMAELLENPTHRESLANHFRQRVQRHYSSHAVLERLSDIYQTVLKS